MKPGPAISAVAMREAAQTAAGLIRAIEDARTEVETASDVALRAGGQASEAVGISRAYDATTCRRATPRGGPRRPSR